MVAQEHAGNGQASLREVSWARTTREFDCRLWEWQPGEKVIAVGAQLSTE